MLPAVDLAPAYPGDNEPTEVWGNANSVRHASSMRQHVLQHVLHVLTLPPLPLKALAARLIGTVAITKRLHPRRGRVIALADFSIDLAESRSSSRLPVAGCMSSRGCESRCSKQRDMLLDTVHGCYSPTIAEQVPLQARGGSFAVQAAAGDHGAGKRGLSM